MAAIPVSFTGVMWYPDLSVGGGPMPGGPPLGIWGGGNVPMPTPPIAPGGPPPGYWGGVAPPFPTHPIAPGGPPPVIWPNPPEGQAPIVSHPIAPGGPPPGIWPSPGVPTHPIVLPPDLPPTLPPPDSRPIDWKVGWTPATGWIVVGVPSGPHPTPSAAPPA